MKKPQRGCWGFNREKALGASQGQMFIYHKKHSPQAQT
jgi:hypothetical protein